MASADADEIAQAVELLLQDVWKVMSVLKTPQHSAAWLSEHQWKQFRQNCVQTIERMERERLSVGLVAPTQSGMS